MDSSGRTVHIVPSFDGNWQVVDLNRHVATLPNKTSAVEQAKAVAASHQPSQVVLFDKDGRLVPIAHYQMPQYQGAPGSGDALIEAAVKALVVSGLIAAGAVVLGELIEAIGRDLARETKKTRSSSKRKRSSPR